jgi:predicted RNase H-like HicB family nuclease
MTEFDITITFAPAPAGQTACIRLNGHRFVIDKDPGSAYGGHFPDCPGCFAAGDDFLGLLKNAAKSLDLWFEEDKEFETADAWFELAASLEAKPPERIEE